LNEKMPLLLSKNAPYLGVNFVGVLTDSDPNSTILPAIDHQKEMTPEERLRLFFRMPLGRRLCEPQGIPQWRLAVKEPWKTWCAGRCTDHCRFLSPACAQPASAFLPTG
jgi:hypothetical protein